MRFRDVVVIGCATAVLAMGVDATAFTVADKINRDSAQTVQLAASTTNFNCCRVQSRTSHSVRPGGPPSRRR